MKKNIILILVVSLISIAVIVISIAVSAGKSGEENSSSKQESSASSDAGTTVPTETASTEEPDISYPETVQVQPVTVESSQPDRVTDDQTAGAIISLARSLIGTDFAEGGDTPAEGFDNSGFIYYVLRENGYITCPRGVSAQSEMGAFLEYNELEKGDLVFFSENGTIAEFGGIYAGDGIMIACLMPGTQVKEVNITSEYYTTNFFRGVAIN